MLTWVIVIVEVRYPAIPQHRIAIGVRHDLINISASPVDIPVSSFFCYWRWLSAWLQMRDGKCGRCITVAVGVRRLGRRLRLRQAKYPMLCWGLRSFVPKNISVLSCRRNTEVVTITQAKTWDLEREGKFALFPSPQIRFPRVSWAGSGFETKAKKGPERRLEGNWIWSQEHVFQCKEPFWC